MDEATFLIATRESRPAIATAITAELAAFVAAVEQPRPLGKALLEVFAELVRARGDPVVDVGCGAAAAPGRPSLLVRRPIDDHW